MFWQKTTKLSICSSHFFFFFFFRLKRPTAKMAEVITVVFTPIAFIPA